MRLRRAQKFVPLILFALLLGAATTAIVAWSVNDLQPGDPSDNRWTSPSGDRWSTRIWRGATRDSCNVWFTGIVAGAPPEHAELEREVMPLLPNNAWRSIVRRSAPLAVGRGFWNCQAYGWPSRSLGGGFINAGKGGVNFGYYETTFPKRRFKAVYPVLPIWPGFALDTVVFALPWFALLLLPGWVRRAIRIRRGLCPRCAYDLRASPARCPECGYASRAVPAPEVPPEVIARDS